MIYHRKANGKNVCFSNEVWRWMLFCAVLLILTAAALTVWAEEASLLEASREVFTGDLDEMKKRGAVRVLVSYNRTNFFLAGGKGQGYEYELMLQYQKFVNIGVSKKEIHTKVFFIPMPFDQLLTAVAEGKGDIAAAGLTVTAEREKQAAFCDPYLSGVNEIIVTGAKVSGVEQLEDLSGRTIHVLRGSSYASHLATLNDNFNKQKRKPVTIEQVDRNMQTEDLLEMVNAGVLEMTVADEHIARLWAELLPDLQLKSDIVINSGGNIAWAVRKDNPGLRKSLDTFVRENRRGSLIGNMLFKRYYQQTRWIKNPVSKAERKKLEEIKALFQKYADKYTFDWLAIAAQAYQESELDHSKKNPSGAAGIMQVLPSTAASKDVNIPDIETLENNIHAGVKYLDYIRKRYFSDAAITSQNRVYFSFAAYNAGPAKVRRMRSQAAEAGLDANVWFDNVELAALRMVGQETVRYVRNILKYYTAYKLSVETQEHRENKRRKLTDTSS